jgi:hypothetical protein
MFDIASDLVTKRRYDPVEDLSPSFKLHLLYVFFRIGVKLEHRHPFEIGDLDDVQYLFHLLFLSLVRGQRSRGIF